MLNRDKVCETLKTLAKEKKKLLIVSHKNPDADTIGSAFALKLIYEGLGGSAKCVCDSDAQEYLYFLYSGQATVNYRVNDDVRHEAICSVDVASRAQLGRLDFLADKFDFMIDHHISGEPFAPYWTDYDASACSELITKIYKKLVLEGCIKKNPDIARRLYAGISADCGSFKFSNTTPETHMLAASLLDEISKAKDGKLSASDIARALYDNKTKDELLATKVTIEKMHFICDDRIAYAVITLDDMKAAGVGADSFGGSIGTLRCVNTVMAAFIIKQQKDKKTYRVSTRSNSDINVSEICARFGGGGHIKASGATITADSPEEAEKIMVAAFEEAINKYIDKGAK